VRTLVRADSLKVSVNAGTKWFYIQNEFVSSKPSFVYTRVTYCFNNVLCVAYSSEVLTRIISINRVSILLLVVERQSICCDV